VEALGIAKWTGLDHYIPGNRNTSVEESMEHQDRYVRADVNGGWPIAAGVVALAVALIVMVAVIHQKTYKPPTDVTWHARGERH
jgi:hypothetical protein